MDKFEEAHKWINNTTFANCWGDNTDGYLMISHIEQALRIAAAVEKHKLALKALDAAGDKATEGEYTIRGDIEDDFFIQAPRTNDKIPYDIEVMSEDFYDDDDLIGENPYTRSQMVYHSQFITKAANSRNAIKDILRENEG